MIVKTVVLACTPERAFELFTRRAGAWWPEDRRHTGDAQSAIELTAEGRFFERARDGREVELGRVHAWEPPHRLVFDFYPGTDEAHPTQVEVRFLAEGPGTRVTVLHGPTEASLALFDMRAPRYEASWERVLSCLAAAARTEVL